MLQQFELRPAVAGIYHKHIGAVVVLLVLPDVLLWDSHCLDGGLFFS